MKWRENAARLVLLCVLIGLPLAVLVYQQVRLQSSSIRVIDIIASIPENGGFQPDSISVQEGETVTLRFSASDVTHGVAIGPALGIDLGDIDPGHIKEVTLTFDKAGTYTFYCNTWCSPKHWRMRGSVHVYLANGLLPVPPRDTVIDALATQGVDIDAMHDSASDQSDSHDAAIIINSLPSMAHGAEVAKTLVIPAELKDFTWRRSHTPSEGVTLLSKANPQLSQVDLLDAVAYLWSALPSTNKFDAASYYAKNCAACHGETGNGQGPMASTTANKPANFSDPTHMATMRDDVLYAKIRRGGMGTDMPNFGSVLTPEETWQLVNYLRRLSTIP